MTALTAERSESPVSNGRNCSIDIARCVFALLVISNHADPLWDLGIRTLQRVNHSVTNIPVAFFSMTAGFFFTGNLLKGKKALLPYLKRIVIPYAIWSVLYFSIDFITVGTNDIASFLKSCVIRFLISGTAYHFWFFPAMMISAAITAVFFKLRANKLLLFLPFLMFVCAVIQMSYSWLFNIAEIQAKIPPVLDMIAVKRILFIGFPYFCGGYLVRMLTKKENFLRKNSTVIFAVSIVLYTLEIALLTYKCVGVPTVFFGQYFVSASLLLFLNEHPMPEKRKAAEKCRYFAGLSYYIHPALIIAVNAVFERVFHAAPPSAFRFVLVCALCAALSAAAKKANNKYINMIAC